MHLRRLINFGRDFGICSAHFNTLAETRVHNFMLNGTPYNEAISKLLEKKNYGRHDPFPHEIMEIIGLSRIYFGESPYIHTAMQILESLDTSPHLCRLDPPARHHCHSHRDLSWIVPVEQPPSATSEYYAYATSPAYDQDDIGERRRLSVSICQHRRNHVNSGRIYRIQREIRLMKYRDETLPTRYRQYFRGGEDNWNRRLISQFLIPILDQCPKSCRLLALIKQRIGCVCLKYTLRRRLTDAVYRYIRRTEIN